MADRQAIVQAYRQLYRQGLKAINYSTPSRHLLIQTLRSSFRSAPTQDFNPSRIANTVDFLRKATEFNGIEHKVVRNLLMQKFWDQPRTRGNLRNLKGLGIDQRHPTVRDDVRLQFSRALMLLNESLGTCLR
ncbi:hypothetical protein BDV18DRAFT_86968 [Aspergillus unguis]